MMRHPGTVRQHRDDLVTMVQALEDPEQELSEETQMLRAQLVLCVGLLNWVLGEEVEGFLSYTPTAERVRALLHDEENVSKN